jgi:hypothetical protein
LSPPELEPRTVQPVSEWLYRLSYPSRPCHIDKCMYISVHVQIGLHRHMCNLSHNIETGIALSCISLTVSLRNAFFKQNLVLLVYVVYIMYFFMVRAGIAQSVPRLATGLTVRGSNPGVGEIVHTRPDRPWGPPNLLYNGYQVFPGG